MKKSTRGRNEIDVVADKLDAALAQATAAVAELRDLRTRHLKYMREQGQRERARRRAILNRHREIAADRSRSEH